MPNEATAREVFRWRRRAGRVATLLAMCVFLLECSGGDAPTSPIVPTVPAAPAPLVLRFTQTPSATLAGRAFQPAVVVQVVDSVGKPVTTAAPQVTLSLRAANGSAISLAGSTVVTATGGQATFSTISADVAGANFQLIAVANGLTSAQSDPIRIVPRAIVIDSTQLTLISDSVSMAAGVYSFIAVGSAPSVDSGTVIVGAQGDGFVRRVIGIERVGSTFRYATVQAALSEVVQSDSLVVHLALPSQNGLLSSNVRGAIKNQPSRLIAVAPGVACVNNRCTVSDTNVVLYGTSDNGVVVSNTSFSVGLEPDVHAWLGFLQVDSARVAVNGSVTFDGTVRIGLHNELAKEGSVILAIGVFPFVAPIGGFPVKGTFYLPLTLEWSFDVYGQAVFQLGWSSTATTSLGTQWNAKSGWRAINSASFNFTPQLPAPSIEAGLAAHIGLQVKPRLVILGTVGADITLQPYAEAAASADLIKKQYATSCTTGVLVGAGADLSILGQVVGRYTFDTTVLRRTYPVCTRTGTIVTSPGVTPNAAPVVGAILPNPVTGQDVKQSLIINGTGFTTGTFVRFRDVTHGTRLDVQPSSIAPTQLQVAINLSSVAATWSAEVRNPDSTSSGQVHFAVVAPAASTSPTIANIDPSPIVASATAQLLTLTGRNFRTGALIRLRNLATGAIVGVTPLAVTATSLTALAVFVSSPATWTVTVTNLDGTTSGELQFNVASGTSGSTVTVSGVQPSPLVGSRGQQTIGIVGSGFVAGATVRLRDVTNGMTHDKTAQWIGATRVQVSDVFWPVPASWTVVVTNPDGQSSSPVTFAASAATPIASQITSISPNSVLASGSTQTLHFVGTGFQSGLRVLAGFPSGTLSAAGAQISQFSTTAFDVSLPLGAPGTWTFQIVNPDSGRSNPFTFQVNPSTLLITSGSLPQGTVGVPYTAGLVAAGGASPYTWSSDVMPTGLTLDPATGRISGTPTASGSSSVLVAVRDNSSPTQTSSQLFSIAIAVGGSAATPLSIATSSLATPTEYVPYQQVMAANGGKAPYSWTVGNGLPSGLAVSTAGIISGTPTTSGAFAFNITVRDASSSQLSATQNYSLNVLSPIAVSTLAGSNATLTTFRLNGSINPNGPAVVGYFQWASNPTLSNASGTTPVSLGSGANSFSWFTDLTGLACGTLYYYRAVAVPVDGSPPVFGSILSVSTTTCPATPTATTQPASGGDFTSFQMNGSINPAGLSTQGYFEWGTTPNLTTFTATPAQNLGAGSGSVAVLHVLTGLACGTSYAYRVVALPSGGTPVRGGILLGSTTGCPPPPTAVTQPATGVTATGFRMNGTVTSPGAAATGYFEWSGQGTAISTTAVQNIGSGTSPVVVFADLTGLGCGAVYTYRLVAVSQGATGLGNNVTAATSACSSTTVLINTSASPSSGGTTSGGGNVAVNSVVTIIATANAGYRFVNWSENGTPVSTTATYQFPATINRTLVANFTSVNITTASPLPPGTQNVAYSTAVSATGGTGNYQWSLLAGPSGLTIGASTGIISGTPTASGTFNVVVQVTSGMESDTKTLTLTIGGGIAIVTGAVLPPGSQGVAYSTTLSATGGTGNYTWSVAGGALPAGLSLGANTGTISGTSTVSGTFTFTVQASAGGQTSAVHGFLLVVTSPPMTITTASPLPDAVRNGFYSVTLDATGGSGGNTWSLASGALPAGLSIGLTSGNGGSFIAGTPTVTGAYSFTLRVTSNDSNTTTKPFTLSVVP